MSGSKGDAPYGRMKDTQASGEIRFNPNNILIDKTKSVNDMSL